MKYKYYSILYLVVILLYLFRPLLPYFDYIINRDYIIENLCIEKDKPENTCNGKCYLHEQLNKQSETPDATTNDKDKLVPDKRMDDHLQGSQTFSGNFEYKAVVSRFYPVPGTTSFNSNIFVPPEF